MTLSLIGDLTSRVEQWFHLHEVLFWWLGVLSVVMFLGTLAALGLIVIKLPPEYFLRRRDNRSIIPIQSRFVRICYQAFKNLLGIFFILAGLAMLVLPGQGLIALIVGFSLTNFPGRHRLVRAVVRRKSVLRSMNWLRKKFDRPPLRSP